MGEHKMVANALKSWKTTLLGILMVVIGVVQATKAPSLKDAFTNPQTQITLLAGVLGFLAKDSDQTGTANTPKV